jgi:hypothetical protein
MKFLRPKRFLSNLILFNLKWGKSFILFILWFSLFSSVKFYSFRISNNFFNFFLAYRWWETNQNLSNSCPDVLKFQECVVFIQGISFHSFILLIFENFNICKRSINAEHVFLDFLLLFKPKKISNLSFSLRLLLFLLFLLILFIFLLVRLQQVRKKGGYVWWGKRKVEMKKQEVQ